MPARVGSVCGRRWQDAVGDRWWSPPWWGWSPSWWCAAGNLQKADDAGQALSYVSAVTVEEKSVWDYDQGNPSGDPAMLGQHAKPRVPLVGIYPKEGTLFSDNPFVVLQGDWVGEPDQPRAVLAPPSPPVLAAVQDSWEQTHKRAKVLLVLDVSGSMGQLVGSEGASRLDLAKRATAASVDLLAPDDQVSLWTFSTQQDGDRPYRELVPFGSAKQQSAAIKAQIADLVPDGGTGLYSTVRAASRSVGEAFDPSRINAVVVLTDGKNEFPGDNDLESLARALSQEDADRTVRVFPIAYGDDADLGELRRIADASRAAAYDASDPASLNRVLTAVLSNF